MVNRITTLKKELVLTPANALLIRCLDLFMASLGLLLLAPVLVLIGGLIKLLRHGPIFHKVERVGQQGVIFYIYQFQYFSVESGEMKQPRFLRRWLRGAWLDIALRLVNVIQGQMSLVGPTLKNPAEVAAFSAEQRQLLAVRPGIISPTSLQRRPKSAILAGRDEQQRDISYTLALELAYLQHRTVLTDMGVILKKLALLFPGDDYLNVILNLRNRHLFVCDVVALLIIPALALTLRLDHLYWWRQFGPALILFTGIAVLVKLPIFFNLGFYRRFWRYSSMKDWMRVLAGIGLSTTLLTVLFVETQDILALYKLSSPRTLAVIDGLLTGLIIGGIRFGLRGLHHWGLYRVAVAGQRTIIVGAGEAGTIAAREMWANPQLNLKPVAFIDDDPRKIKARIHGLPVLGSTLEMTKVIGRYQIERIVVAIPSASLERQRAILALCQETGLPTDNLPGIYELLAGNKTISLLPRVNIQQLLHREPIEINQQEVAGALAGETVLVTGAGGSIGSELCRQIARFGPKEIILLGHGENSIFEIALDLRLTFPELVSRSAIVDVRNRRQVCQVVEKYQPQVIFHAAAHKHVPFMEENIEEAITNNVLGTKNVVAAAEQYGVERLVLISSDKAVNPNSIMGTTKRLAELLVTAAARRSGRAYMAVRFGNVLGSRGSVIPIFQRQIAAGGPVTITHPDMQRYFMTIPEAVQLVLQAGVLGRGGEIFVLDMGQPVRILDLAIALIQNCGLKPGRDIKIVYSGIRPGEKLNEELFLAGENYQRTRHAKIFVARPESNNEAELLEQVVLEVVRLAQRLPDSESTARLKLLLPLVCYYLDQYRPQTQSQTPPQLLLPKLPILPTQSLPPLYPRPTTKAL